MQQPNVIQHQIHGGGQPLVIQIPHGVDAGQATAYVLDASGNVTLSNTSGNILTVDGHLVQGHAQVQEVHLTDERGNIQQVTYLTNSQGAVTLADGSGLANVVVETGNQTSATVVTSEDYGSVIHAIESEEGGIALDQNEDVDSSYHYYDNIRGKINSRILTELVTKYDAENPNLSKNDRLQQWSLVTSDYQNLTGQSNKSRTALMKRWSSAKYYREHEGRPVEQGGRVKGIFVKGQSSGMEGTNGSGGGMDVKPSNIEKNLKEYEALQLEAARLERDAQRVHMENALVEQERLRKEAQLAAIELNTAKLELAMLQEEARKMGLVIQFETTEEEEEMMAAAAAAAAEGEQHQV